ncbi:MAG: hypothetical protein AAGU24_05010 [Dehalogenimonas sp.]
MENTAAAHIRSLFHRFPPAAFSLEKAKRGKAVSFPSIYNIFLETKNYSPPAPGAPCYLTNRGASGYNPTLVSSSND